MVRAAVVFTLAAAVEGVRLELEDAEIATGEADANLTDADFDYEAADALDWDEELAGGDFKFEELIDPGSSMTCHPGQGGIGQWFQSHPFNTMGSCAAACAHSFRCDAFDYTTSPQSDACRFFHTGNNVRLNVGVHNRQYCYRGQVHGPHYNAPVQAGSFMVADGCRRSQGNHDPEIRNALNGFASVRCCSNNGRRCETTSVGCLRHQTFAQATAACSSRNMRLCSVQELDSGVCCGTGCGFDGHHIWTMTPAGGGFVGQNGHGINPASVNGQFNGQHGFSGSTFNGAGFHNQISDFIIADGCLRNQGQQRARTRNALTGRASVRCCSLDGSQCETQTVGCLEGMTFNEANAACSQHGLRLCAQNELERGVCCGTGCGFDGRRVWTNTPAR